jgi:hypothetical protein
VRASERFLRLPPCQIRTVCTRRDLQGNGKQSLINESFSIGDGAVGSTLTFLSSKLTFHSSKLTFLSTVFQFFSSTEFGVLEWVLPPPGIYVDTPSL